LVSLVIADKEVISNELGGILRPSSVNYFNDARGVMSTNPPYLLSLISNFSVDSVDRFPKVDSIFMKRGNVVSSMSLST
jgi:hypothetical protein